MTFAEKLKGFGPGILMATAAVGGSHLVAATQAGALFGWQLVWLILAVNLLKYPFFRFGVEYTLRSKESLVSGYKQLGKPIFFGFIALNIVAAIVNTAGVLLLTASLLFYALPWQIEVMILCYGLLAICLLILMLGHYKVLDSASKIIMVSLTLATLAAFIVALSNGAAHPEPASVPNPYQLAMLGFLVVLMGWMPAPIEISAINSLWLKAKTRTEAFTLKQGLLDFNTGYMLTAVLAVVFCALGVLIQYGSTSKIELAGVAFSKQLIEMYTTTIGEWSRNLVAGIAFLCMFGTTLTVLDGYARTLNESVTLLKGSLPKYSLNIFVLVQAIFGLSVVVFFKANLKDMLTFAMTLAFVTTPLFALFNLKLMHAIDAKPKGLLKLLTYAGLLYLFGFTFLFLYWKFVL
ncbi:NRAMP family divalent metal transporter [Pseudoalteromonas xiamenensis]|uniref:Divalent metal cation transporter n=1 Tax=Pseudoalteromonas xiamenensis TaxID=882626 RepID=A0A975DHN7_9GAMM|nr:divalent metal cation transporter [Pseudoalteromonas xiamenensis]QTH72046.1 divalent metal cation transporter [Pseudoalteromonas xiamenensis]